MIKGPTTWPLDRQELNWTEIKQEQVHQQHPPAPPPPPHTHTHTHDHTHVHKCTHASKHTHTHTYAHMPMCAHMHADTCKNQSHATHPFQVPGTKEDGWKSPVECQLGAKHCQRQTVISLKATSFTPHQVGGIPHAAVQVSPHRWKHPFGRLPRWLLQVLHILSKHARRILQVKIACFHHILVYNYNIYYIQVYYVQGKGKKEKSVMSLTLL